MEFSKISVLAITLCVACFVTGDLSEDRVSDAWAEFYKSYYEQHSGAEERDLGGFGAPSSSYAEPAAPSTGYGAPATSYDSPAYGASFSDVKGVDLLSPETTLVIGAAGLLAGMIAIGALVVQSNQVSSICTTTKALGDTSLTALTTTELTAAGFASTTAAAKVQAIITAINGYATPDCST